MTVHAVVRDTVEARDAWEVTARANGLDGGSPAPTARTEA